MYKWTNDQLRAIEYDGASILYASAGTGKTAVLAEKVIRALDTEGVGIEDLLLITFSNAAAGEMKNRIKESLESKIKEEKDTNKLNKYKRELLRVDSANIRTIHSFCNEIVNRYGYTIGLGSALGVQDISDAAANKKRLLEDVVIELKNNGNNDDLLNLFKILEGARDPFGEILSIYDKVILSVNIEDFLESVKKDYMVEGGEVSPAINKKLYNDFLLAKSMYMSLADQMDNIDDKKMDKNKAGVNEELQAVCHILDNIKNGNYCIDVSIFKQTLRFPKEYASLKDTRDKARTIVNAYQEFDINKENEKIRKAYPCIVLLTDIIRQFNEKYEEYKIKNNIIDFSDMEKYSIQILKNDHISHEIKNRFFKVFVDEYQDTSPLQEAVIEGISREDNLFCVGDYKQSIYGFRASDPGIFLRRKEKENIKVFFIRDNFRSDSNIINATNDVFRFISGYSRDMVYSKEEELFTTKDDIGNSTSLILINNETDKANDLVESENVCSIIKDNIGKVVKNIKTGEEKVLEYSDFAVIVRKLSGVDKYLASAMKKEGIPFTIERAGSLLDNSEVELLINALKLLDGMADDISIISVCHAGLFGLNDEFLLQLKNDKNNKSLQASFYSIIDNNKTFTLIKENIENKTPDEIIPYIINRSGIKDFVYRLRNADDRMLNLYELGIFASRKGFTNLSDFLVYMDEMQEAGVKIDGPRKTDKSSVKIMTIHKSKGLEFPFVIMPFMSKQFSKNDTIGGASIDVKSGVGLKYIDNNIKGDTMIKKYIDDNITQKLSEEEMRLLYVAMTRAENHLVIQGKSIEPNVEYANSMMDWVLGAVRSGARKGTIIEKAIEIADEEDKKLKINTVNDFLIN